MDKLAKEQLHPIGPSQALVNCCDAVVDKLHPYGDVCIVDDRVYYDLFASVHVVIIGDLHWLWCTTNELELRMQGCFLFRYTRMSDFSACLCGPCILVRETDVSVLVHTSNVHLGLLIPSSRRLIL